MMRKHEKGEEEEIPKHNSYITKGTLASTCEGSIRRLKRWILNLFYSGFFPLYLNPHFN